MEIKIRNVDPIAVKKIDEMAKEKKISRQEFLKGQLETLAFFREQVEREHELESLIEKKYDYDGKMCGIDGKHEPYSTRNDWRSRGVSSEVRQNV